METSGPPTTPPFCSTTSPRIPLQPRGYSSFCLQAFNSRVNVHLYHSSFYYIIFHVYTLSRPRNDSTMQPLLLLLFTLIPTAFAASASGQGSVSLWSDSSCEPGATSNFGEPDPVALNYTLATDVCGTPGATAHSYIVNERPTCANGSTAAFAFYNGVNCQKVGFGPALNSVQTRLESDGQCLALVEFRSVAFLCDGLGSGDSIVSLSSEVTSITTPVVTSATPVSPSQKVTAPLYTTTPVAGSPTTIVASGTGVFPGVPSGTVGSSPAAFTGGVSKMEGSILGVVAVAGVALVL